MREFVGAKVRISVWFTDTVIASALVNPEDRATAYVLLDGIDAKPRVFGRPSTDVLNYLRGLPSNARLTDQELRRKFTTRIQKTIGRRFSGGSRAEIEAALQGAD